MRNDSIFKSKAVRRILEAIPMSTEIMDKIGVTSYYPIRNIHQEICSEEFLNKKLGDKTICSDCKKIYFTKGNSLVRSLCGLQGATESTSIIEALHCNASNSIDFIIIVDRDDADIVLKFIDCREFDLEALYEKLIQAEIGKLESSNPSSK